jgi:hypothetical protein
MEAMIRKQKEREEEQGKDTAFMLRGRPVDQAKIDRYKRDHGIDADVIMGEDAIQPGIESPTDLTFSESLTDGRCSSHTSGYHLLYSSSYGAATSPELPSLDTGPLPPPTAPAHTFIPAPSQGPAMNSPA